jgi:3-isopropylmalate/(R)-2-methylmalate dehydratase large subunit
MTSDCSPRWRRFPMLSKKPATEVTPRRAYRIFGPQGRREDTDLKRDGVLIGSCTNAWLEDLRAVARVVGRKIVNSNVKAMIVPGLGLVKEQVEAAAAAIAGHFVDVRERH